MSEYTIQYNPNAYAIETASANVKEELKGKVRISQEVFSSSTIKSTLKSV